MRSAQDHLSQRHCQPRRGEQHRLTAEQVAAFTAQTPDWAVIDDGTAICRSFSFPDYYHTMAFVNALAWVAHREDHHPDLSVHYNRCVVRFSTHDVGGLSENDFICAAKADSLA